MRQDFSPRSKKGAALALVLIITTAMLILAAALLAAANFNIDYTSRGVQGRQAYLSAKSAVEYARAYVSAEKEGELATLTTNDILYVIAKNGALTTDGFEVVKNAGSADLDGKAYASISLTPESLSTLSTVTEEAYTLTIRGYAPRMDQKGGKTLGYQYKLTRTTTVTPPTPPTPSGNSQHGFVSAGNIAEEGQSPFQRDEPRYIRFLAGEAALTYPFVSGDKVFSNVGAGTNGHLTAPQMYFLYLTNNGEAIEMDNQRHLTLSADFIFYNGSRLNRNGQNSISVTARDGVSPTILYFSKTCTVNFSTVVIAPGYYQVPPGEDILGFTLADWDSFRIPAGSEAYAAAEKKNRAGADGSEYLHSISAEDSGGWVQNGRLAAGSPSDSNIKWNNSPNWATGKRVFCYVTSAENWGVYQGTRYTYMTYSALSMYWNYVNPSDWVVPEGVELSLNADIASGGTVTLNTMASQEEPDTHPALVAGDADTEFYIHADKFIVTCDLTVVYYKNKKQESYVIEAGVYTHNKFRSNKGVDLFHPDGQNAVFDKGPDEPLPDDGGGSGGSEGDPGSIVTSATLSGGRYTDG